jgi:hypothetical protein
VRASKIFMAFQFDPATPTLFQRLRNCNRGSSFPFFWAILREETRSGLRVYNQFLPAGNPAGLPNLGPPDGWGLGQLNYPGPQTASTAEVYNWKINLQSAFQVLRGAAQDADEYFRDVKNTYPNEPEAASPLAYIVDSNYTLSARDLWTIVAYNGRAGCFPNILDRFSATPWKYFSPNSTDLFPPPCPTGRFCIGPLGRWCFRDNSFGGDSNYGSKVIHELQTTDNTQE